METKTVIERITLSGGRVDRTGPYPIIRDVLFCGQSSANKRRYKSTAFDPNKKIYEGKPVCIDHAERGKPAERGFRDKVAWVENERRRADGMPMGDIGVNPKHADAESFLWAAEHKPDYCGMSHRASILTSNSSDGWEDVEQVVEVSSLDVVIDPATTRGIFESKGNTVPAPVTFAQLVETITRHPKSTTAQIAKAKFIAEDMGAAGYGDAPALADAPTADADTGDTITAAFESAIMSIVKDALAKGMDKKSVLKTIGKLLDGHADAQGGGEGDKPAAESVNKPQPLPESWAVLAECKKAGLKNVTESQLKVLSRISDSKERAEFIAEIKDAMKGSAETPVSGSREQIQEESHRAGKVQEQKELDEAKGANGKQRVTWD
jgi:hypothetical protein